MKAHAADVGLGEAKTCTRLHVGGHFALLACQGFSKCAFRFEVDGRLYSHLGHARVA